MSVSMNGVAGSVLGVLENLAKAGMTSEALTNAKVYDLEMEAHNWLWSSTSANELTMVKMLPITPAKQVVHEYRIIKSYGHDRNDGFFSETTLPPASKPSFDPATVNCKLIGAFSEATLLASLEQTVNVAGATGAVDINRASLHMTHMRRFNRALYFADSRKTSSSMRFKGLLQQIDEGTASGQSEFGSHVIDMEGAELTLESLRPKMGMVEVLFGDLNTLVMSPQIRQSFERSLDGAMRGQLTDSLRTYQVGNRVAGITTQSGELAFANDNILSPIYCRPNYTATDLAQGYPTGYCTGSVAATPDSDSKFNAADEGQYFWVVTEVVDGREGKGTRIPSTGYTAVAAGDKATLTLTPSASNIESFKIYRFKSGDPQRVTGTPGLTEAAFAFEVAAATDGNTSAVDKNHERPNTGYAFGLSMRGTVRDAVATSESYDALRNTEAKVAALFDNGDNETTNSVGLVTLGPKVGAMSLANILPTVDRPLFFSASSPIVRNPRHQIVFKNVGVRR